MDAQIITSDVKEVDAVFVDDDKHLLDSFILFAVGKKISTYHDPQHFLDNVHLYARHTKIILDYHFDNFVQRGTRIAEQLHALGFTRLYLLSGRSFSNADIPDYVTPIMKTDLDKIERILNE